jgi:hypothetical protein
VITEIRETLSSSQAVPDGERGRLGPAARLDLAVEVGDVALDGIDR